MLYEPYIQADRRMMPASGSSQKETALRRGKAMSFAPIINGMM